LRFLVLVVAAAVTGAVSVVGFPKLFPEQHASMVAAMRAAGVEAAQFSLADLNPLRWDYDYVARQIASPNRKLEFPVTAPVVVDQSKMLSAFGSNQLSFGAGFNSNSASQRWHSAPSHR
jgi:hypothetical protein